MTQALMALEVARHYMYRDAIAQNNAKLAKVERVGVRKETVAASVWYPAARLLLVRRAK
jgi:hypothetical protein